MCVRACRLILLRCQDFWTTRCVRCPAALDALDALAAEEESGAVVYVSVNLDDLEGARKVVSSAEG